MIIVVKPSNKIKQQVNLWNGLRIMAGQDKLPVCDTCGAVTADEGPKNFRCRCNKRNSN